MLHYHGGPITPNEVAVSFWTRRHAMVSFYAPHQIELAAEVAQTFALDNGAFSAWIAGSPVRDWTPYIDWAGDWGRHPGCDFALIPDEIEGDEAANDRLVEAWIAAGLERLGVPVWHLHESTDRLARLAASWPRVALGSSGDWPTPGMPRWWDRMEEALDAVCDEEGRPRTRLHGLRMLDPTIFSHIPFASADSTNVARNIGVDAKWDRARYAPKSRTMRAFILAERIECHAPATIYVRGRRGQQQNLELIG